MLIQCNKIAYQKFHILNEGLRCQLLINGLNYYLANIYKYLQSSELD